MEETTDLYWDCECATNYIHFKYDPACLKCGRTREESPDSRIIEVLYYGLPLVKGKEQWMTKFGY